MKKKKSKSIFWMFLQSKFNWPLKKKKKNNHVELKLESLHSRTRNATILLVLHLIRWFVALLIIECHQRFCHHLQVYTERSRVTVWSRDFCFQVDLVEGTNSTWPDKQWIALQGNNNTNKIRLETPRRGWGRKRDGWCALPFEQKFIVAVGFFSTSSAGFLLTLSRTWTEDSLETRIVYGMWLTRCGCSPSKQVT